MDTQSKDKRINKLISLFTNGEIERCQKEATQAVQIYPTEPFIFNILGVTYAAQSSFSEAIKFYKKAAKLNPEYFEVFNNMGVAYNDWKKPELAVDSLNQAIRLNPCLLYTSPSPRDATLSRMPSSA